MNYDNFINLSLTYDNLDRFYTRKSILKALTEVLPYLSGKLLDAGCGRMPYRKFILDNSKIESYTGLDIDDALIYDDNTQPDVFWDGKRMPFEQDNFDCVIATEVLEHCPYPDIFLSEVFRVLKPQGFFFFTVPFLWTLHEVPNDEYRYTPFALNRLLKDAGFKNIELKATGGWHASMGQMLGLWVKRSPISPMQRKALSLLFKPVMRFLFSKDKLNYPIAFAEQEMITGISGVAFK